MASSLGLLCKKHEGSSLCFKHGGSSLIYKVASGQETTVTFAWGSDAKDLDIAAYWEGAPSMIVGYGYDTSTTELVSGHYHITYSGDKTSSESSEWCRIKMAPWGTGDSRKFRVHFNYYGFGQDYPGSTCTVIASQANGPTLLKTNQACATAAGQPAHLSDPYCVVEFDQNGTLISLV